MSGRPAYHSSSHSRSSASLSSRSAVRFHRPAPPPQRPPGGAVPPPRAVRPPPGGRGGGGATPLGRRPARAPGPGPPVHRHGVGTEPVLDSVGSAGVLQPPDRPARPQRRDR